MQPPEKDSGDPHGRAIDPVYNQIGGAIMKKYEIMYILKADLDEGARKDEIAKLQNIIESEKGKVTDTKEWGVRDFAYPIKEQSKGYYVILKVNAENPLKEFPRVAKLDANVLRHLITVDED